ncbi:hypothetical protein C7M84_008113 [Penaeus vannamei]|uniref:Uncharacterized protein n=1 Tax=Penaeus vannamei TaxID=6689 RepID=A0A423TAI4_PENVA|nr:hypothetical protein C7M84_008113 [Penaeus vannamei]
MEEGGWRANSKVEGGRREESENGLHTPSVPFPTHSPLPLSTQDRLHTPSLPFPTYSPLPLSTQDRLHTSSLPFPSQYPLPPSTRTYSTLLHSLFPLTPHFLPPLEMELHTLHSPFSHSLPLPPSTRMDSTLLHSPFPLTPHFLPPPGWTYSTLLHSPLPLTPTSSLTRRTPTSFSPFPTHSPLSSPIQPGRTPHSFTPPFPLTPHFLPPPGTLHTPSLPLFHSLSTSSLHQDVLHSTLLSFPPPFPTHSPLPPSTRTYSTLLHSFSPFPTHSHFLPSTRDVLHTPSLHLSHSPPLPPSTRMTPHSHSPFPTHSPLPPSTRTYSTLLHSTFPSLTPLSPSTRMDSTLLHSPLFPLTPPFLPPPGQWTPHSFTPPFPTHSPLPPSTSRTYSTLLHSLSHSLPTSSLHQECARLRSQTLQLDESLQLAEGEAGSARQTVSRLVNELDDEKRTVEEQKLALTEFRKENDDLRTRLRALEEEVKSVRERLHNTNKSYNATLEELHAAEKQLQQARVRGSCWEGWDESVVSDHRRQQSEVESRGFLTTVAALLSTPEQRVAPDVQAINDRIQGLVAANREAAEAAEHIERLTSQVTSLGEQSRRQSELYETAVKRGRQCEAEVHALTHRGRQLEADAQTAEAAREHVVIEKEKVV